MNDNYKHKLTDEEFLEILKANDGLFSLTAKAIEQKYGITYSRQAVFKRAQKFKDEMEELNEELVDLAENNIKKFLKMDSDPVLQFKTTIYVMNNRGGSRGYGKFATPSSPDQPEQVFEVGGKMFKF